MMTLTTIGIGTATCRCFIKNFVNTKNRLPFWSFSRSLNWTSQRLYVDKSENHKNITCRVFKSSNLSSASSKSREASSSDIALGNGCGKIGVVLAGLIGVTGVMVYIKSVKNKQHAADEKVEAGLPVDGLPTYTKEDVWGHNNKKDRIWMTYKNGVYDVTEYIGDHPGGLSIMLSAGIALEPFFSRYNLHYHDFVLKMMENYRIGNIYDEAKAQYSTDPYENEPSRNAEYRILSKKPFNAEHSKLTELAKEFLTPNDQFFIRNHFLVPVIEEKDYELCIYKDDTSGDRTLTFSLDNLKRKFPKRTVVSTIQCVENRRSEMRNVKRLYGLKWGPGAIGNAKWSGVCLEDVLTHCGIDLDTETFSHIHFEGFDKDPSGKPYTSSVPVELVKRYKKDIILAYEMNDEELPRDHGYPIRVVLPGVSGARQVKWLRSISLSNEESRYHWQYHYKPFLSNITWNDAKFECFPAIQDMPVQSAICEPLNDVRIADGKRKITASGYAWSGGGRAILCVELSIDGGITWTDAELQPASETDGNAFAWTLWKADIDIPADSGGMIELMCRAVDSSLNIQPRTVEEIWNFCGVLNNACHRITLYIPNN